ncbi:MAG: Mu-like prophage major head subunit gpT family protein [Polyangiaceae bacterium]|nr:Mu-like prophage major head subunit gpT family protein [Polyangiaceae bacterium]
MLWTAKHVIGFEDRLKSIVNDDYQNALRRVWWPQVMGTRPSSGKREIIEWLLTTAQIVDLPKGEMQFDDLVTQTHEAVNVPRGGGLRLDRDHWEDDEAKFAAQWAAQMGSEMALSPQYECVGLFVGGEQQKAYDGRPFFAEDHPVNPFDDSKGTYRNLVTDVSQMDPTLPALPVDLSPETFALGVAHMKTFVMPNGRNRDLQPVLLAAPPQLESKARTVTGAKYISATDNVLTDYHVEPLIINQLSFEPRSWYLLAQQGGELGMPFMWQERTAYGMTSYTGLTDAELSRMNKLEWHVRGRNVAYYGHPYLAIKFKVG